MTDTKNQAEGATLNGKHIAPITLRMSSEMLAQLKDFVSFDRPSDVQQLVADALNSYVTLGTVAAKGGEFYLKYPGREQLVRVRFPFSPSNQDIDGESE